MIARDLVPLDEWIKQHPSKAAAARALGVDWQRLSGWLKRTHYAERAHRQIAAQKGVSLPERP